MRGRRVHAQRDEVLGRSQSVCRLGRHLDRVLAGAVRPRIRNLRVAVQERFGLHQRHHVQLERSVPEGSTDRGVRRVRV